MKKKILNLTVEQGAWKSYPHKIREWVDKYL